MDSQKLIKMKKGTFGVLGLLSTYKKAIWFPLDSFKKSFIRELNFPSSVFFPFDLYTIYIFSNSLKLIITCNFRNRFYISNDFNY